MSDDLINWSAAQVLLTKKQAMNLTAFVKLGMNYPTFIDPTAPVAYRDRNFGVIGQHPYLFWVSKGDNPEDIGRHLLATPFTFDKTGLDETPRSTSATLATKTDDAAAALDTYSNFQPGKVWLDTDGEPIRAHSAGLVQPHTKTPSKCVRARFLAFHRPSHCVNATTECAREGCDTWLNLQILLVRCGQLHFGRRYQHMGQRILIR